MYNFLAELQIVAEIGPIVDGLNISYKIHTMVYVIPKGITIEKQSKINRITRSGPAGRVKAAIWVNGN